MQKNVSITMASIIGAIITTSVLAFALPNQVFAQSNTGGGLGQILGHVPYVGKILGNVTRVGKILGHVPYVGKILEGLTHPH
jgi:hypothetical protein